MTTTTFASISCPGCDRTSLVPVDALLVSVSLDDRAADSPPAGTLGFACDICLDLVAVPLGWAALLALVTAGATLLDEADDDQPYDERPPHPENPAAGAPLTHDDLLALHELLASGTWFDQVATAGQVQP